MIDDRLARAGKYRNRTPDGACQGDVVAVLCCLFHGHGGNRNKVAFFQAAILEVLSFVIAAR